MFCTFYHLADFLDVRRVLALNQKEDEGSIRAAKMCQDPFFSVKLEADIKQ